MMDFQLDGSQKSEEFYESQKKIYQEELSFLNLHALNKSFHEKSSSSSDSSSDSESFDKSSESNPYGSSSSSSSGSSENIQEAIKQRIKSQKLVRLHTGEKTTKNISVLLQHYLEKDKIIDSSESEIIVKLIKKINLLKFDIIMFYLAAQMKEREDEIQILFEKLKLQILDTRERKEDTKVNQIIYQLIEENKKKDKTILNNFIKEHGSYFFKRVLEDKTIFYELFLEIISYYKIMPFTPSFINELQVPSNTVQKVLLQKRYDQILFLVKNNIKIVHTFQIALEQQDRFTYDGYLNKPLLKMNLRLVILFYLEKQRDLDLIKQLLFDVSQTNKSYMEILQVLIKYRANSIAKDIYRILADKKYPFDDTIFEFTFDVLNYDLLWFISNQQKPILLSWLEDEETQQKLVNQLYKAEGKNFEYLIFYLKNIQRIQSKKTIRLLGETLIHRMESSQEGQFIYTFYNPLKISLLVCELLQIILNNTIHHKNILNKAHDLYYKFAQIYCFNTTDHQLMIELFKDIDLEKRKLVFLINQNNSALILSTQIVEDAIESMWNGNIAPRTNMLEMFSITQNLLYKDQCDYLIQQDQQNSDKFILLNPHFQRHHFFLQRVVWTYNCKIRNFIDQCLIILLMLLIFANFIYLFNPQHELQSLLHESILPDDQSINQQDIIINNLKDVYLNYQIYLDIIISLNFTLKVIFTSYYNWSQKVYFSISIEQVLQFTLGILSLFQIILFNNINYIEEPIRFKLLLCFRCIYIGFVMLQCIFSLKSFKFTGPMIRALYLVILECNKFSLIFIVVNFLFGFMAYFSFFENSNNRLKTLIDSILYLVEALFGQFSFDEFSQPSPIYGAIFLNVYLFVSPVIFMQLLVAVLTFTFEKASRSGRIDYNISLIQYLRYLEYDSGSGSLVTLPILASFFNFIFIIPYIFQKNDAALKEQNQDKQRKISKILVKCGYFPIYLSFMIVCIIINLICSPLFYIVKFFRIMNESQTREQSQQQQQFIQQQQQQPLQSQFLRKVKRLIKWLLFGYYYMLVQLYNDLKINHEYLMHGKYLTEFSDETISNSTYSIVASVAKSIYLNMNQFQTKIVLSEFLNAILNKIKIMDQKLNLKQLKILSHKQKKEEAGVSGQGEKNGNHHSQHHHNNNQNIVKSDNNIYYSNDIIKSDDNLEDQQNNINFDKEAFQSPQQNPINTVPDSKNVKTLTDKQLNDINESSTKKKYSTMNFFLENDLVAQFDDGGCVNLKTENGILTEKDELLNLQESQREQQLIQQQQQQSYSFKNKQNNVDTHSLNFPFILNEDRDNDNDILHSHKSNGSNQNQSLIHNILKSNNNIITNNDSKSTHNHSKSNHLETKSNNNNNNNNQKSNDNEQKQNYSDKKQTKNKYKIKYDDNNSREYKEDILGNNNNNNVVQNNSMNKINNKNNTNNTANNSNNLNPSSTNNIAINKTNQLENPIFQSQGIFNNNDLNGLKRSSLFQRINKTSNNLTTLEKDKENNNIDEQNDNFIDNKQNEKQNNKLQLWAQLSDSYNIYQETPIIMNKKSKKSTYQMWKELKKEDNQNKNSVVNDMDLLFQFLDAFVVEEELIQNHDDDQYNNCFNNEQDDDNNSHKYSNKKNKKNQNDISNDNHEIHDLIFLENLLKLMYHYSKNNVRLARFNIVSSSIKILFSGNWIQPDPMQSAIPNQQPKI